MPFATVNGVELYHELHGDSGEPLVFVHGYTGDCSDWEHQVAEFAPDYRLLVLDNRGHGQSQAPADINAYSVDQMVVETLAVIAMVGFERYHLVGHSMGGAIAQEIALLHADRLLSLTLQDTSHSFADHDEPGGTLPYVAPEQIKIAAKRIATMSKVALVGGWKGLTSWRGSTDRAHMIGTPTLILYGDRDASRIIEGSQRLDELLPNSTLVPIAGAGHSPQSERPDAFNSALRAHLQRAGT